MKKRLVIDEVEYPVASYVDMPDDVYHWVRSRKNGHEFVELRRDFELERIAGEQHLEEQPNKNLVPQSGMPREPENFREKLFGESEFLTRGNTWQSQGIRRVKGLYGTLSVGGGGHLC